MWFDQLVVLHQVEIDDRFRGSRVGAWAAARALSVLARDEATLVVLKAAPVHVAPFRTEPRGPGDSQDLTAAEKSAWDQAQRKIAAHWE
jgi:hypothetical protein